MLPNNLSIDLAQPRKSVHGKQANKNYSKWIISKRKKIQQQQLKESIL